MHFGDNRIHRYSVMHMYVCMTQKIPVHIRTRLYNNKVNVHFPTMDSLHLYPTSARHALIQQFLRVFIDTIERISAFCR